MATQIESTRYDRKMLGELQALPRDVEVWEDPETRTLLAGDDVDNNSDYDVRYVGTVGDLIPQVKATIEAAVEH